MYWCKFVVAFGLVLTIGESKSVPVKVSEIDGQVTVLNMPTVLPQETIIYGETTNVKSFSVMITEESVENVFCEITFRPTDGTFTTENNGEKVSNDYDFLVHKFAKVSFNLHMTVTNVDMDTYVELSFKANNAGPSKTNHCRISQTNVKDLRYIVLKEVQYVKTLTFNFEKPND